MPSPNLGVRGSGTNQVFCNTNTKTKNIFFVFLFSVFSGFLGGGLTVGILRLLDCYLWSALLGVRLGGADLLSIGVDGSVCVAPAGKGADGVRDLVVLIDVAALDPVARAVDDVCGALHDDGLRGRADLGVWLLDLGLLGLGLLGLRGLGLLGLRGGLCLLCSGSGGLLSGLCSGSGGVLGLLCRGLLGVLGGLGCGLLGVLGGLGCGLLRVLGRLGACPWQRLNFVAGP